MDLSLLVTIVAVIGLLGTAAAVVGGSFRVSRNTQVVANYRDAAQAWEAKSTAQEGEIGELREQMAQRESELNEQLAQRDNKIIELTTRVSILQDMVTGKNAVEQILPEIHSVRDELLSAIRDARR